jgi:hypothetical protein
MEKGDSKDESFIDLNPLVIHISIFVGRIAVVVKTPG